MGLGTVTTTGVEVGVGDTGVGVGDTGVGLGVGFTCGGGVPIWMHDVIGVAEVALAG